MPFAVAGGMNSQRMKWVMVETLQNFLQGTVVIMRSHDSSLSFFYKGFHYNGLECATIFHFVIVFFLNRSSHEPP